MKKPNIVAIVAIVLAAVVILVIAGQSIFTGKAIAPGGGKIHCVWVAAGYTEISEPVLIPGNVCTYEGTNKDYYHGALIEVDEVKIDDDCASTSQLIEYWCDSDGVNGNSINVFCEGGCKGGTSGLKDLRASKGRCNSVKRVCGPVDQPQL